MNKINAFEENNCYDSGEESPKSDFNWELEFEQLLAKRNRIKKNNKL